MIEMSIRWLQVLKWTQGACVCLFAVSLKASAWLSEPRAAERVECVLAA